MDNLHAAKRLREAVKAESHRLGFELFGVTTPDPPPHLPVFQSWLESGRHGKMDYLAAERARQRRADPRLILPECRSILVVGMRYPAPESRAALDPLAGRVAAYAWTADYHVVIEEKLAAITAFIEARMGFPVANRRYTDTGPVLERDLAQRAGLGWIGKNTCLIHPRKGSYFLLGEILLAVDLEVDPPFVDDRCGSCTRCLDACPTGCILPDRTLDARRCISYLTIELKDSIPLDLRAQIGNWVFGCDICQQVCPWNRRFGSSEVRDDAQAGSDPLIRPDIPFPDLIAELELTPEGFNHKFKSSPIKRAKRRGYLRNAAVALGNSGQAEAAAPLLEALRRDPEPLVRAHAAWALGNLNSRAAFKPLTQALENETDPGVRLEIEQALQSAGVHNRPAG